MSYRSPRNRLGFLFTFWGAVAIFSSGCSSWLYRPYDPTKSLEFNHSFLGSSIYQDGSSVDVNSVLTYLKSNPEILPHAEKFNYYRNGALGLGIAGVVLFGSGAASGDAGRLIGGIAATGLGAGLEYFAGKELQEVLSIFKANPNKTAIHSKSVLQTSLSFYGSVPLFCLNVSF